MYGHQGHQADGHSSRVEGPWRFSPSGHTVVAAGNPAARGMAAKVETRDLFATREIVGASNETLERVGSPLRLETSEDVPVALGGKGLLRVSPVRSLRAGPETKQLRGDELLTLTECDIVADLLAGEGNWRAVYRTPGAAAERPQSISEAAVGLPVYPRLLVRPDLDVAGLIEQLPHDSMGYFDFVWQAPDGTQTRIRAVDDPDVDDYDEYATRSAVHRQLAAAGLNAQTAETLARALNQKFPATPIAQQLLVDIVRTKAVFGPEPVEDAVNVIRAALVELSTRLAQPYAPYDDAGADARRAMAERFGVNEAALPGVGEAFAILSTRPWTPQEVAGSTDAEAKYPGLLPWSYHLATVIAVDGGARITLENYNRQGAEAGAAMWFHSMYGPEPERLFHRVHAPETAAPVTLVLRKPAT